VVAGLLLTECLNLALSLTVVTLVIRTVGYSDSERRRTTRSVISLAVHCPMVAESLMVVECLVKRRIHPSTALSLRTTDRIRTADLIPKCLSPRHLPAKHSVTLQIEVQTCPKSTSSGLVRVSYPTIGPKLTAMLGYQEC
jgi:hypothetical protein